MGSVVYLFSGTNPHPYVHPYTYLLHVHHNRYLEMGFEGMFEYGQAYVAISRATDLPGLSLRSFDQSAVKVHPAVVQVRILSYA